MSSKSNLALKWDNTVNTDSSVEPRFENLIAPQKGERIIFKEGKPIVPANPIVPFIEGDGIGKEIWNACHRILNKSLEVAYHGKKTIEWFEIFGGGKALAQFGTHLPNDTLTAIEFYGVGIKGPLETPVGKGVSSINVRLRQKLDLYSCIRPIKYYQNIPSPMKHPEKVNMTIFRENTEDVYAGVEFRAGSKEAKELVTFINDLIRKNSEKKIDYTLSIDSAVGIKPMTSFASKRLMRMALDYAIAKGISDVTIVHKGNIMKFTEGGFREWCLEVATQEYGHKIITENELQEKFSGKLPSGKILVKDRIADNMLQQTKLKPERYGLLVTPNLAGDLISDDLAALVGGLGIAPGANVGDSGAIFEATHGTAPDIAGKNFANPCSLILSGVLMFEFFGWFEAAKLIESAIEACFKEKVVTSDFRDIPGAKIFGTQEFADEIIKRLK